MVRADVFLRVLLRFSAVRLRREPDNFKFLESKAPSQNECSNFVLWWLLVKFTTYDSIITIGRN